MAYRRTTRSRSGGYSRAARRAPARRSGRTVRRRSSSRSSSVNTMRIVIETHPASPVSRPDMAPLVRKDTGGKAKL